MTWKHYLAVSLGSLFVILLLARVQAAPGYMDAEYYYSMGLRIANGKGLSEPFIWNYLTPVDSIPHPGFSYWMPFPAFVSAAGILITGWYSFSGAKIFFLLIAACVPALSMKIAWEITREVFPAVLAGCLAVFPAFYSVFLGTTDSFGITMVLGGIFFLLSRTKDRLGKFIALGCLAGLMHLTRADGLVWLVAGGYCGLLAEQKKGRMTLGVLAGYLLVMAPWFGRNWAAFGALMPPGTSKSFWLQEYNDLFNYSTGSLTFQSWFSQGWKAILRNFQAAGAANLKNLLLVQGQVILTPLIALGAWRSQRDRSVQALFLVWLCIFLLMTFIFPFAGIRGGYTHSAASFQPLIWALAGIGFGMVINWGVARRDWTAEKAEKVFGSALVLLIAISSVFIYHNRVIGEELNDPQWQHSFQSALAISQRLDELGAKPEDLIMINNPPGFYAASGRSSIVIPNGGLDEMLAAGKAYQAKYLVLESNHPQGLSELYAEPEKETKVLFLEQVNDALIFQLSQENR